MRYNDRARVAVLIKLVTYIFYLLIHIYFSLVLYSIWPSIGFFVTNSSAMKFADYMNFGL